MQILVGADPELFLKQDGQYISAHNLIPGNKLVPHPVNNGAVQVDGMAAEFNIDPADTEEGFFLNLQSVMQQLRQMLPDYEVVADPVARFTPEYMQSQPEDALELGCDPDFNAWTSSENTKPDCSLPIRTGAGHVHIGWTDTAIDDDHIRMCEVLVRQLDFYLGLPSLLFDTDHERRSMYGQAGAYRPKSYGVEYRVLSNQWLSEEKLMRWVFRNSNAALHSMIKRSVLSEEYGDIQEIINTNNVPEAKRIIAAAGIECP